MKIIIYNPNTKEWNDFINSLNCKGEERDKIIQDYIIKIGQEIGASEFVNNNHIYTDLFSDLHYKFIGEPNTLLEKIVRFIYSGSYIDRKRKASEDFTESRTDWDEMIDYADEMADFIKEIMEDLAK